MNYFLIDNLVFGGAERQASYLIDSEIDFDKVFLLENVQKYKVNKEILLEAFYPDLLKIYQRIYKDKKIEKSLTNVLNSQDKVISFLERSNLINIKTSRSTKHKTIISVRNFLSERYKSPKYLYRKNQIKKYYPKADKIITNSFASKDDLVKNFNVPEEKIEVIYNVIDLENVRKSETEEIPNNHKVIFDNPVILNIGSLISQKCQKQLIEAFYNVKKEFPKYKLVIIGTGNEEINLINTIKRLNLNNEVFLLGNVKNPFKYLKQSDVFVLNSAFEGFPNVLLESLATGTPVVTKNCLSGPSELLNVPTYDNESVFLTDYGYIFPKISNKNKKQYTSERDFLTESICKLIDIKLNNKTHFELLIENCKARAQDFSKEKIISQWKRLYNNT